MKLIDGKFIAKKVKSEIRLQVEQLVAEGKKKPHLAAVLVGDDGASQTYVNAKVKACDEVGFDSTLIRLEASATESEILKVVDGLNQDSNIDGFIVQLPLPKGVDESKVTLAIDPKKDVDGFHPENLGRMMLGLDGFLPATPFGITRLLEEVGVDPSGKNCVVVGRSHIVGSPMSVLLSRNAKGGNGTVTMLHSRSKNIEEHLLAADIVVVAVGKHHFLKADMVKEGAVVIDVGMHRIPDASKKKGFHLAGDVDFDGVSKKAMAITPVPGGVGPMTIVSLLQNTLKAVN